MRRRKDYLKFKELLESYHITRLYHFTDRSNIESIVKNGGLYSWGGCLKKNILISRPGGSDLSHELDQRENLQDYVRISLCKYHPMMYSAMRDGRILNPVILEIDTDMLYLDGNLFANKNAVRADVQKGATFNDFQSIHFITTLKNSQFDIDEEEQEYYQAEILINHHIPLCYILNISDFIEKDAMNKELYAKVPYSAKITDNNPAAIIFLLNQSYPTKEKISFMGKNLSESEVICDIINQQIQNIVLQNTDGEIIHNRYDISIIGYGDYSYNCLEGKLQHMDFASIKDLKDYPICTKTIIKERKTRQGLVQCNYEQPIWIKPRSTGNAYLHTALKRAEALIDRWIVKHPLSYPPTIIHISSYGYNGIEDSEIIQLANEIKTYYTNDGNTILINLIFSAEQTDDPVLFPESIHELKESAFEEMYYIMSSQLPLCYNKEILNYRDSINPESFHTGLTLKTNLITLPKLLHSMIP